MLDFKFMIIDHHDASEFICFMYMKNIDCMVKSSV